MKPPVRADPWQALRRLTPARIALGRAGASLPTAALLEFGVAEARARDAVHVALDATALCERLGRAGEEPLVLKSAITDRAEYLRRPDLGRRLDERSREAVATYVARAARGAAQGSARAAPELLIVIADGLSASAVERHALPLMSAVRGRLAGIRIGPIVIALQARVALGDEIGERLGAAQVAVLIGERPGLSSPDSLGVYFTHAPRVGRTDAERNCISNIRPEGLGYEAAAERLVALVAAARVLGRSGVELKEENAMKLLPGGMP